MFKFLTKRRVVFTLTLLVRVVTVCGYVGWSFMFQVIIDIATGRRSGDLAGVALWIVGYMIIMDGLGGLDQYLSELLKWRATARARTAIMAHVFALRPQVVAGVGVGTVIGKLTKQLDNVSENYYGTWLQIFYVSVQALVATLATLSISPLITVVILVLSLPAAIFPFVLKRALSRASDRLVQRIDGYTAKVTDLLNGFQTLQYALAGPAAKRQHRRVNRALVASQQQNSRLQAVSFGVSATLNDLSYMAAWLLGALLVRAGQLELGQMVVFSTLTGFLSYPMMALTQAVPAFISGAQAAKQLAPFTTVSQPATTRTTAPFAGGFVDLHDVEVRSGQQTVLKAVNLALQEQRKVLVVGASGSGKTSLVRVLLGEVAPTSGRAELWGAPADAIARQTVYQRIAFMAQAGYVFTGTVRENLTLFGSGYSDDALKASLVRAGLGQWLTTHQLDTPVSPEGFELSGGERQRLALARLLLRQANYFIFDELTTGLDPLVAAQLQRDLLSLPQGWLMITHTYDERVFAAVDEILVMRDGEIAAQGDFGSPTVQGALVELGMKA